MYVLIKIQQEEVDIVGIKKNISFVVHVLFGHFSCALLLISFVLVSLCLGGLITICATIYCFDNEVQEQLLTAYGFLSLYCLYKVNTYDKYILSHTLIV